MFFLKLMYTKSLSTCNFAHICTFYIWKIMCIYVFVEIDIYKQFVYVKYDTYMENH